MDDEMDYVIHRQESSPPQLHHHHHHQHQQGQQQQQRRQCPYWADHQLPVFSPHYANGLHSSPHAYPHAQSHNPHNPQTAQNPALAPPPNNRSQASHPYDPVYASISSLNNFHIPPPSYHWPPVTLPQPRPSIPDSFYAYPNTLSGATASSAGTSGNNNTSTSRGVGGQDPSSPSGPVQPSVAQSQQSPRHDPFTSFSQSHHHQQFFRFGAAPSQMSAPAPNQQSGQQSGHPPVPFTAAGSEPPGANERAGIGLPVLSPPFLPHPAQASQQQPPQSGPNGIGTISASQDASSPNPTGLPRPLITSTGLMLSGLPEPPRNPALSDGVPHRHVDTPDAAGNAAEPGAANSHLSPPIPIAAANVRRQAVNTQQRQSESSEYDSDEELLDAHSRQELRILDQFAGDEARIRAQQVLRGQITTKRVASRSALTSLQSVEISSLPENEKTCIICYNDFGVETPEGINEAPLRLPRCKHIFGDHCIKKWFEESDSCPYCRSKVPSEPQLRAGGQALREFFRQGGAAQLGMSRQSVFRQLQAQAQIDMSTNPTTLAMLREAASYGGRADASPQRAWQTGDRRSPPSEATENRRRTRARHGSLRGSAATNAGATGTSRPLSYAGVDPSMTQHQQSPGRDRVNPPHLQPHWLQFAHDPRAPLTPVIPRQLPAASQRPQSFYNATDNTWQSNYHRTQGPPAPASAEPLGLNPPSVPTQQQSFSNSVASPASGPGSQEQTFSTPSQQGGHGGPPMQPFQSFSVPMGIGGFGEPFSSPAAPNGFGFQNQQGNHRGMQGNNTSRVPGMAGGFSAAANNNQNTPESAAY